MATIGSFLQLIGFLAIILGLLDYVSASFFGKDFTGVIWSPVALGVGGGILAWVGGKMNADDDIEQDD